jgi:hypothetical protein
LRVEYCWWGKRNVLLTPSIDTALGAVGEAAAGMAPGLVIVVDKSH